MVIQNRMDRARQSGEQQEMAHVRTEKLRKKDRKVEVNSRYHSAAELTRNKTETMRVVRRQTCQSRLHFLSLNIWDLLAGMQITPLTP